VTVFGNIITNRAIYISSVADFVLQKGVHSKKSLLHSLPTSVEVSVPAVCGRVNEASCWNVQSSKRWSHSVAWHKNKQTKFLVLQGGRKLAIHEVHMYIIG